MRPDPKVRYCELDADPPAKIAKGLAQARDRSIYDVTMPPGMVSMMQIELLDVSGGSKSFGELNADKGPVRIA